MLSRYSCIPNKTSLSLFSMTVVIITLQFTLMTECAVLQSDETKTIKMLLSRLWNQRVTSQQLLYVHFLHCLCVLLTFSLSKFLTSKYSEKQLSPSLSYNVSHNCCWLPPTFSSLKKTKKKRKSVNLHQINSFGIKCAVCPHSWYYSQYY